MSATINLSPNDKIIVVLGATGAGKSTFIDYATNGRGGGIGHGMRSFTDNIRVVRAEGLTGDGRPVVFVDIPGFGATDKSNVQILAMVASFLARAYANRVPLDTILYMHRITDNRVSSVLLENLQLFKDACGLSKMPRAVLVTTMWKLESEAVGEGREKELKEIFWKDLIEMGSKVERFEDTSESARRIAFGSSDDQGEVGTVTITTGIVNEHGKVIGSDFTRDAINQKAEKEGNKKLKDVGRHKGSPALSKRSLDTSKLPADDDNVHGENWLCIPRLI